MKRSYFDILDTAARQHIPDDVSLFPNIITRLERKTPMQTLRTRPVLFILVMLMALSLLSGVVYAVGRSLGYIPGVGIVEQDTPIRILAEPVSQTRDGITLTVEQVVLTSEKTFLSYNVEGIPHDARPKGEGGASHNPSSPTLLLPDGSELFLTNGNGSGWESGYQNDLYYPAIPIDVNTVTFALPSLMDVAPNAAPQDWALTLEFVPAPEDFSTLPIIEVATPQPSPTLMPAPVSLTESEPFMGLRYQLQSVQQTDRGYILDTSLGWDAGLYADYAVGTGADITLTDANGQTLTASRLDSNMLSTDPNQTSLRYSLDSLSFTAPLTLTLPWVSASLPPENSPHFTFDPGASPQPGQEWPLNQTIDVSGQPIKIISARYVTRDDLQDKDWIRFMPEEMYGFEFTLEVEPALRGIALSVQSGYSASGMGSSGSSTVRDENGIIKAYAMLSGEIIAPLEIGIPYFEIDHPWQITFDPAALTTGAPIESGTPLDISLQIEKVIPLDDGYYLLGRTSWNNPAITETGIIDWSTKLLDESGAEYPIEPVQLDEIGITDAQPEQWAFKVYGHALPSSMTLQIEQAHLQLLQPYTFVFDPGTNPQVGQEWQINQMLEILGSKATVLSATYIQQGDMHGFRFSLTADAEFDAISISIEDGIVNGHGGSGGGYGQEDENDIMVVDVLSDGEFDGPVLFSVRSIVLNGKWQTTWTPPASNVDEVAVTVPEACITLEKWKQAAEESVPLPSDLTGKIASMVHEGGMLPTIYVSNLDGSDAQSLAVGAWASMSHDGTRLAYSDSDGLHITDLTSGENISFGMDGYQIIWSPDDTRLIFTGTFSLYLADADGSDRKSMEIDSAQVMMPIGWLPDGQTILYSALGKDGFMLKSYNMQNGVRQDLFTIHSKAGSATLSPDGQWLAYVDQVTGKMTPGLYLSRLDGSEKQLLVQLDHWVVMTPVFSPDGRWLIFNVLNTDLPDAPVTPALVNLETCQVFPLLDINGEARGWVQ